MRILFFSRLFYPHIGGVETHLLNLSDELIKKCFDVVVVTSRFDKTLSSYEEKGGLKILRIDYPEIKFLGLFIIWFNLIFKHFDLISRADIVHIHDVFIWYLPFRLLFPHKGNVFITFHGYPSYPLSKKTIFYQRLAEKLTAGNICIGDFMKKWYGTSPNIISYGAVDSIRFKPVKVKDLLPYDAVFFGRLGEQTGILTYLKAVKMLQKKESSFKLLVVGDGKYKNKVLSMKGVSYSEPVENVSSFIQQSKFVFVSRYLSILEALASKKLVFAVYDNPLKEDYLKMSPFADWVVIENSPDMLVKKVEYFLENPKEANEKIEKGYKWAREQSWEKLTDDYLKLWGLKG